MNEAAPASPSPLAPYRDELLYYRFRQALRKAGHAIKRLRKYVEQGDSFQLTLSAHRDKPGQIEYRTPDEKTLNEFLYAIAPIVDPGSPIHWGTVLDALNLVGGPAKEVVADARDALGKAEQGQMQLAVNANMVSAREDLFTLLKEVLYGDDTAAAAFMATFYEDPITSRLRLFRMHAYATDLFNILDWLAGRLESLEVLPRGPRRNSCIYCRQTETSFRSVEHVVPESLGNDGMLLPRGWVCDKCNQTFSKLEKRVLDQYPLNILRFIAPTLTKKGKFPELRTPKFHLKKRRHHHIVIEGKAGRASTPHHAVRPDGVPTLSLSFEAPKFDPRELARLLIKIGLGCLAIEHGPDAPVQPQFADARRFAVEGGQFPSRLWMETSSAPRTSFKVKVIPHQPAGHWLYADLLGAQFVVGLSCCPLPTMPLEVPGPCMGWDLWREGVDAHHLRGPTEA